MLCDCHKSGEPGGQAVRDCHEAECEHAMFDQVKDLADRLEQLHRERQGELERGRTELEYARWPWLRRLDSGGDGPGGIP